MFTHFLQVISIVFLQIEIVLVRLDSGSITVYYGLMKVHMCFQLCMLGFIEGRLLISKAILNKPLPTVVISNQICQIAFIQNTLVSYQNESVSSKWELPFLPPSSLKLWRKERARRQLSWDTQVPPNALMVVKGNKTSQSKVWCM